MGIIPYYGGKMRMAPKIVPLLPRHTVYVEPFAGGLSVFAAKPWPCVGDANHYREVVNDVDGDLVNFYTQLRDQPEELHRVVSLSPHARSEYEACKRPYPPDLTELERARRYYVNASQSFSGKINRGWRYSVSGGNDAAMTARRSSRVLELAQRMSGVFIECKDALEVIERWDSPQTLFYCDPPYPGTEQGHYDGYTLDDFKRLTAKLHACQGSWLLSGYDQPGVEFAADVERFEFEATCSASRDKTVDTARVEVVWRRLRRAEPTGDAAVAMASSVLDVFEGEAASHHHQGSLL